MESIASENPESISPNTEEASIEKATEKPTLRINGKQVSYRLRQEDLDILIELYAFMCNATKENISYVNFFRSINASLLESLKSKPPESIIIKNIEVFPTADVGVMELLKKQVAKLQSQLSTCESNLIIKNKEIERLQNIVIHTPPSLPIASGEKIDTAAIADFESALSRRMQAALSESRENFINQLYEYAKATQPAKHLL